MVVEVGPQRKWLEKAVQIWSLHIILTQGELGFQGTIKWWEMSAEQMTETSGRQVCVSKVCLQFSSLVTRVVLSPEIKEGLITVELFWKDLLL